MQNARGNGDRIVEINCQFIDLKFDKNTFVAWSPPKFLLGGTKKLSRGLVKVGYYRLICGNFALVSTLHVSSHLLNNRKKYSSLLTLFTGYVSVHVGRVL